MDRVLRRSEVYEHTGLSYSTLRRLEASGRFPRRRRLGPRSVGWLRSEVEDWMAEAAPVEEDDEKAPTP